MNSGGITAEIVEANVLHKAVVRVSVTSTTGPVRYVVVPTLLNGELIYEGKSLQMTFKLYGKDHLYVPYTHNGSPGEYELERSK